MADPLRCVFISFEAVPFAKVGGLADVAGALPDALRAIGVESTLVMPRFGRAEDLGLDLEPVEIPADWFVGIEFQHYPLEAWKGSLPGGTPVYFIGEDHFFGRPGIYNDAEGNPFGDELERYVYFSKGAVELIKCLDLEPDIIHCNDYQTGLVTAYVRDLYEHEEVFRNCATVYSIHNMAYQGAYLPDRLPTMGFAAERFVPVSPFECHGTVNMMKLGIHFSDAINTVSPTYAQEIMTPDGGCGLDDLLRHHADKLTGILNGIDTTVWNPATDEFLPHHYTADSLDGKRGCKGALLKRSRISLDRLDRPLVGMIGRLVEQKGIDLVAPVIDDLLRRNMSLVVLGSGARQYEDFFRTLAHQWPDRVGAAIGFDNELAHQITAAADIFLMPSRYEPCGLNQMYSMAYGTVPVVRRTGGLADTVRDWDGQHGTGFSFADADPGQLHHAMVRALQTFEDREAWSRLVANGMSQDFGWPVSAARYEELYREALERRRRWIEG